MTALCKSNEYKSPARIVLPAAQLWGPFDLDPAAAEWNTQAPSFFTRAINGLKQRWFGKVWLNPPYSRGNLLRWMAKARDEVLAGHCERVVCLVPCYPTEAWWKQHVVRPEGQPLGAHWLWGRYPAPLGDARRLESYGLTVTVIDIEGRLSFRHRTGPLATSRFGNSLVVFQSPLAPENCAAVRANIPERAA